MNYLNDSIFRSEVNLGVEKASFTVMRHYSPSAAQDDKVRVSYSMKQESYEAYDIAVTMLVYTYSLHVTITIEPSYLLIRLR